MNKHPRRKSSNLKRPKRRLGIPDLDHSKSAVLDSLRSPESKRGYRHAIDEFIRWYCSEPRLSFNRVVVTRYRIFLENRQLAAGTINGRLAAVRRLAYKATDAGLLSPELAAGIRRVKGVKKLGVRLGNWPTNEEARRLWQAPTDNTLKGKRDTAILASLLGCGLRGRELADLEFRAAATRVTLGHGRSCRERGPHQDGTGSRLGQDRHRCLDIVGRHLSWKTVSLRLSSRDLLGRWRDRTCCVAHGERVREKTWLRDARFS